MRYVIRVESEEFRIKKSHLALYEILSVVIKRLLFHLKEKIINFNDNL